MPTSNEKRQHGFAIWDKEDQMAAAKKGGMTTAERKSGHRFTPAKGAEAGKKGGIAVSQDREHMRRIGRLGALAKDANRKKLKQERFEAGSEVAQAMRSKE